MKAKTILVGFLFALGTGRLATAASPSSGATVCNFGGTATFSPNLSAVPSLVPIAFSFTGTLSCSSGANATYFNNATVSAGPGTLGVGASCAESTFCVGFTITTATNDTCTGSIACAPVMQGFALAGVASSLPVTITCPGVSGTTAFQLQFATTGGTGTILGCTTGGGVSSIAFDGLAETVF